MKKSRWKATVAAAGFTALASGCTTDMSVRDVGSFYVGGRSVTLSGLAPTEVALTPGSPPLKIERNGDFQVEAMYARYTLLSNPKARYPLLLWHGGGLSGATWETTPDGRPGWESFFLTHGHSVYVSDAMERGRASWAQYPEIYKSTPVFRTKKEAWELFRIGGPNSYATDPQRRVQYPDSRFPGSAFDDFAKQSIPRWVTNDVATQAAYDLYVEKVCPCTIVVHSQGGNFALNAALKRPDLVKAVVAVETPVSPQLQNLSAQDARRLASVPILWVWGDHTGEASFWRDVRAGQQKMRARLKAAGSADEEIELPKLGIHGNSHMMMMDRNSDQIASLVQLWLEKKGMMK